MMRTYIRKMMTGILLACVLAAAVPMYMIDAWAASAKISFSDPSTTVGSEVSVNLKVDAAEGAALGNADITVNYDSSMLEFISGNSVEGGAGSVVARGVPSADNKSVIVFSMKFKALQAGSTQLSIARQEVYDADAQIVTISHEGKSTVTVQALATASTDAALASLTISPGTLNPAFSPDIESYTVSVGADVEKITVDAQAASENANVVVSGSDGLQMGENTVVCKVTAEDGRTIRNYTISVTKSEGGETEGAIGSIGGESTGITLDSASKSITILTPEEGVTLPAGFSESVIEIDGTQVKGWVWSSDPDYQYCVFYGMNENGEKNFYRYDRKEMTLQRYFQDPAVDTGVTKDAHEKVVNMYNSLYDDYKLLRYGLFGMIAVAAVLLIVVIVLAGKKNGRSGRTERKFDREDQELSDSDQEEEDITLVRAEPARKLRSREERYMMGEEDEFDYEDLLEEDGPSGQVKEAAAAREVPVREVPAREMPVSEPAAEEVPVRRQERAYQEIPVRAPQTAAPAETDMADDDFEVVDFDEL